MITSQKMTILRDIITRQKESLKLKLSREYVSRDILGRAEELFKSGLIKVIIGPRRAGKSVLALILLKNKDFAYLDLDDEYVKEIIQGLGHYEILVHILKEVYGDTKNIFIDEIQNMPRWELFANRLHGEGYNVVLTGSNSNLLSRELSTHLTGRHYSIEVMPFNFRESALNVKDYMENGGYPEIVTGRDRPESYLKELFNSVIYRDVISRYRVRFTNELNLVAEYLLNNFSKEISFNKISNVLEVTSSNTIKKYVGYLEESYLFFILSRFSLKIGERMKSPKKVYVVDNGYIKARATQVSPDHGKLLENMFFTELVKKGFIPNKEIFYYKTRNQKEVDFVVIRNIKKMLFQVSYDISDLDVKKREVKALLEASEDLSTEELYIITLSQDEVIEIGGTKIKVISFAKWALG
jgi:hypothetical protein